MSVNDFQPRGHRRRWSPATAFAACLAVLVGGAQGCSNKDEAETPAKASADKPAPTPEAKTPAAPVREPSLLDGIIDRAIEAPPDGGSTYRIDAYVGAIVIEQLQKSPLPFTAWRNDGGDTSQPDAGYRVGPLAEGDLWTRLGLKEGDIIHEVNGIATSEDGWVAQALDRGENRVTVSIFRDDVTSVLSYRLMGGMAWEGLRLALAPPAQLVLADPPEPEPEPVPEPEPEVAEPTTPPRGSGGRLPRRPSSSRPPSGSGGGSGSTPPPSSGGSSSRYPPGTKIVANCSSETRCTLKKSYFDAVVRNPSRLQSQANIVPAIRNNVHSGYKLKNVKSGSAIDQLGFKSNDKITHVNGRDLTNDFEAMQVYMSLSSTRRFKVRYVRGSSVRNKTIDIV